jgi:endonuclease/exonuclease/phosphatase family metal-dependent hydrolase
MMRQAGVWVVGLAAALLSGACATSAGMRLGPAERECPGRDAEAAGGAITWYGPAGQGDAESNERWCETVGLAVVERLPRGSFPKPGAADSLAVVAWNVLIGGGDVPLFLEEVLGYECHPTSPALGAGFSHFVLLIQEAYRRSEAIPDVPESFRFPPRIVPESPPAGWPDIVELARDCGLALFYVPSQRNGPQTVEGEREDKGNAILSTLPLEDVVAIELPFEAGRKVAVTATIAGTHGARLRVTSVHLDVASTLYRTLKTANTARLRQAAGLIEALSLIETGGVTSGMVGVGSREGSCGELPGPIAAVAAGDFNTWSAGESAIDQMRLCFPDSPSWDGKPTYGTFPTDYIFFRRAADGKVAYVHGSHGRIEKPYGSDHQARIAWFRFSE